MKYEPHPFILSESSRRTSTKPYHQSEPSYQTGSVVRRRQLLLAFATAAMALGQRSEQGGEERWRNYVEWSSGRRGNNLPDQDYRDQLLSEGVPITEVDQRVHELNNRLLSTPKGWQHYFNKTYGRSASDLKRAIGIAFDPGPNALLREVAAELTPGTALDVAMGQGRNAVYLAQQGWDVSGFDVSDVGLLVAKSNARRAGVTLKTALASHGSYGYGTEQWDLIVMAYPFTPLNERFAARIVKSLRPGGVLVYEHLLATGDTAHLVTLGAVGMPRPDSLPKLYSGLDIERHEIIEKVPDWGPLEPTPVVRMVARKP
jgi:2-polyprenyl-3-methyl-5-hydroxy-6-metoxy-1,4-benzoquinol methylase